MRISLARDHYAGERTSIAKQLCRRLAEYDDPSPHNLKEQIPSLGNPSIVLSATRRWWNARDGMVGPTPYGIIKCEYELDQSMTSGDR